MHICMCTSHVHTHRHDMFTLDMIWMCIYICTNSMFHAIINVLIPTQADLWPVASYLAKSKHMHIPEGWEPCLVYIIGDFYLVNLFPANDLLFPPTINITGVWLVIFITNHHFLVSIHDAIKDDVLKELKLR